MYFLFWSMGIPECTFLFYFYVVIIILNFRFGQSIFLGLSTEVTVRSWLF